MKRNVTQQEHSKKILLIVVILIVISTAVALMSTLPFVRSKGEKTARDRVSKSLDLARPNGKFEYREQLDQGCRERYAGWTTTGDVDCSFIGEQVYILKDSQLSDVGRIDALLKKNGYFNDDYFDNNDTDEVNADSGYSDKNLKNLRDRNEDRLVYRYTKDNTRSTTMNIEVMRKSEVDTLYSRISDSRLDSVKNRLKADEYLYFADVDTGFTIPQFLYRK